MLGVDVVVVGCLCVVIGRRWMVERCEVVVFDDRSSASIMGGEGNEREKLRSEWVGEGDRLLDVSIWKSTCL